MAPNQAQKRDAARLLEPPPGGATALKSLAAYPAFRTSSKSDGGTLPGLLRPQQRLQQRRREPQVHSIRSRGLCVKLHAAVACSGHGRHVWQALWRWHGLYRIDWSGLSYVGPESFVGLL